MNSSYVTAALPAVGFPIRTSTDQSLVGGSPWLIAATHVLRRLLEPRHPPHALSSLVTLNSGLPSRSSSDAKSRSRSRPSCCPKSREDLAVRCFFLPFVFGCQSASTGSPGCANRAGLEVQRKIVELIGIEPMTSSLQSWRSTN